METVISRSNPGIDPHMHLWGWEIPGYLFLGGLTAGLLVLSGIFYLFQKKETFPFTVGIAPIFAPLFLSLGMFLLFLDLEHKLFVWRLYLAFRWTSPMSWGAWALVLIYPSSILFALVHLPGEQRSWIRERLKSLPAFLKPDRLGDFWDRALAFADARSKWSDLCAWVNVVMGTFIGIYTGILLSSFVSRPFWNTPVLGFLFLASGVSAASAFIMLGTRDHDEERFMLRLDVALLILELFLLTQIFIGYFTQSRSHNDAGMMIFGGDFTGLFWMLVVLQGLLFPLFMEVMELFHQWRFKILTPAAVLLGGVILRVIFVYLGQISEVRLSL